MGGKVDLRCKGKTLLGIVNKLFVQQSYLTLPTYVWPKKWKQSGFAIEKLNEKYKLQITNYRAYLPMHFKLHLIFFAEISWASLSFLWIQKVVKKFLPPYRENFLYSKFSHYPIQRGLNRWSNNSEQKLGFLSKVKI